MSLRFKKWWVFGILLLIAYGTVLSLLTIAFRRGVALDRAKVLEEATKILAAYILSLVALFLSLRIDQERLRQTAAAARALVLHGLKSMADELRKLNTFEVSCFLPAGLEGLRQAHDQKTAFSQLVAALADPLGELLRVALRDDPRAAVLNCDLIDPLRRFQCAYLTHSPRPSFESAQSVKQAVESLLVLLSSLRAEVENPI
jgi:hypothetical protein